jgi:hypothetical protein
MEHPYNVRRVHDRKWVVSADGRDVLVCGRLCDALAAAKDADELFGECLAAEGRRPPIKPAGPPQVEDVYAAAIPTTMGIQVSNFAQTPPVARAHHGVRSHILR